MNYSFALNAAVDKFRQCNPYEISRYSGYPYDEKGFHIELLGEIFKVEHPSGNFNPEVTIAGEIPIFTRILVLHYLTLCKEVPPTGKLISFKELPGGMIYREPFHNRAIRPFIQKFGTDPELFLKIAENLHANPLKMGDAAVTLNVFPRIPVTLVLWLGDDEFPASGNILFDASAAQILETEDYAVLASLVANTLIKRG